MQPAKRKILRERGDALLVMHELGSALRRSLGPTEKESLPPTMAMLLMQLALAEVVRTVADDEPDTDICGTDDDR
ncbi:hypothetical protein ACNHKD_08885 [Methylocystis sp. JAN1]|uniref:hypothetical protein n=1 Tax=Methylocystis sp. JAN1 TaxID=3397211 RepID=UPI003FA300F4